MVLYSVSLPMPSPVETKISRLITSPGANSQSSTLYSGVSWLMITSFPSIKCFLVLWERTPWTGLQSNYSHAVAIFYVTVWLRAPTLIVLTAALKAALAARTASAYLPDDFPPTTIVWAAWAANPSIWAPNSILTKSSFLSLTESSEHGDICPIISFTLKQVGNAIPLSNFFDFLLLKTFYNSSTMKLSMSPQIVAISASATAALIALSSAAIEKNKV